ncbi:MULTISPECIES: hypothetical protein [Streptomyces]|uniref:hypothetical protein n=1 Tax=Streptomyces TaxID=1883 RepID=UPI0004C8991F|nr:MULTISPECIES: hypothetical protein [Streptomyces]
MTTPTYEQIMAEELPTGRFGYPYRPHHRREPRAHAWEPTDPAQAARHADELAAAAATFRCGRHARRRDCAETG